MKVYVYVHEWQFDSGDCGMETRVFDTVEKAKKQQMADYAPSLVDFQDRFGKDCVEVEKTPLTTSVFERGEYCYNHENFVINILEVE